MGAVLTGAAVLALGALVGALAPAVQTFWVRYRDMLLTMSAGLLTGTALLHLLPDATGLGENIGYAVLGGFLGVLLLEAALHGAVADAEPDHSGEHHVHLHMDHEGVDPHEQHLSASAFVGFSLHGLVDGAAISAAESHHTVLTTTVALLAHHIPLAASYASLLKLAGRPRAYWPLVVTSSIMPVLGVVLVMNVESPDVTRYLSGVAAGVFLYVATHNLLPMVDLRKDKSVRLVTLLAGALVAWLTRWFGG